MLPEADGILEPAFGYGASAEAEAVGQTAVVARFGIFLFIILSMKSAGNVGALAYWRRNASRRSKSLNVVMLLACCF